jgi:nucleoside-triphosphatase THEP1
MSGDADTTFPITALIYSDADQADETLRQLALTLMEERLALAGLVQHNRPRPGRSRCDMILEDLCSGGLVPISQDRGPHARGCALDVGQLLSAMETVRAGLKDGADIVILNKFGKTESEGGGFRELIGEVIAAGLPLVIAVPWRNIESWRSFAGGLAREWVLAESAPADTALVRLVLGQVRQRRAAASRDGEASGPAALA